MRTKWIASGILSVGLVGCAQAHNGDLAGDSASELAEPAATETEADVTLRRLDWSDCGGGFECTTAALPLDYSKPRGDTVAVAVTRLPAQDRARRVGSLFINFGGPGGDAVASLQAFGADLFATLNQRFDIVGFDPRGTGQTQYAIDCAIDQEKLGLYRQPFTTPDNADPDRMLTDAQTYVDACVSKNPTILPYASTADAARDMDALRAAVGDPRLNYLGFSYGTFLGATYASLFPGRYRALVLDGALDPDAYINRPSATLLAQNGGFDRALDRFFQACAVDQTACLGFGGSDPHAAFDNLVASARVQSLPAAGDDPRPVGGDDILAAAFVVLYAKQNWPLLAQSLALASQGDGSGIRFLADAFYGRLDDGTYDPLSDRYFVLGAVEQVYSSDIQGFLQNGALSWSEFDHAWWNAGYYAELPLGLFSVHAKNPFRGPFRAARSSPTVLVVGTTYDPATPYRDAKRMVAELGNARLLTMQGDGHTAYGGNSSCIDSAVEAYFLRGTLPKAGTVCLQDVPFAQPDAVAEAKGAVAAGLATSAAGPLLARAWAARGRH
ncbi:MAG TPA: alpha/beta hydrolase [Polyangiaceae bacterium]|nr:alpha/beta hydrolase [Polyangiaceae bacterium]